MKGRPRWRGETRPLDDTARKDAEGSFIQLARGYTHFEMPTSPRARHVVLIHGFSVPYFIWDPTFPALIKAGHCPIRYDLYGRGYSERPRLAYGIDLFVQQLDQLVGALGLTSVDLVALSMGGPIAAAFTVLYPKRVRRLVLIAPTGVHPVDLGRLYGLAIVPGISDLVFGCAGNKYMLGNIARDFFDPSLVDIFRERYRIQMEFHGFRRAILSSVRNHMLGSFSETYSSLGKLGKPTQLIWGQNDTTVPFEHSRTLLQLLPDAELVALPDCGHVPHFERPDLVNPRLVAFLD